MALQLEIKKDVKIKGTVAGFYQSTNSKGITTDFISLMCFSKEFHIPKPYSFKYSSKWKFLEAKVGDKIEFFVSLKRYLDTEVEQSWPFSELNKLAEVELLRPKKVRNLGPQKKKPEIAHKSQLTHLLLIILNIAGEDVQHSDNFEEAYRKRLKFQKQTDWKRYRASIDLIEDTEQAILSTFRYQLGDLNNKNKDFGETYLRLYGVLNAVYLQMNAFKEVANLLNFPDRNQVMPTFESLDIYRLRNIAGAHTTDYMYSDQELSELRSGTRRTTSVRIIQMSIDKTGKRIQALDENGGMLEFNLLNLLHEYEKLATGLLIKLIHHMKKVLLLKKEDRVWVQKRLDELIPVLIDYAKEDMNKNYKSGLRKRISKGIESLKEDFGSETDFKVDE